MKLWIVNDIVDDNENDSCLENEKKKGKESDLAIFTLYTILDIFIQPGSKSEN